MGLVGHALVQTVRSPIHPNTDYSIHLSQNEYTDAVKFAPARRLTKHVQKHLGAADVNILRGVNGEIQWLATNTRPDLAAGVSISAGNINKAEIADLQKANKLVKTAKADADIPVIFNPIPVENIRFISFSDSSWANRSDGSSQGGQLHLIADKDILDGKQPWASMIDWKSWKLKRVTRSSQFSVIFWLVGCCSP